MSSSTTTSSTSSTTSSSTSASSASASSVNLKSSFESNFAWAKQSNFYSNPQETASRIAAEILEQQERGNKRRRPNTKSNIVKKKPDSQMTNVILVHGRQRGNPLLKHIKFVKKEFHDDIKADYVVGTAVGVLFLSVKYPCGKLHVVYNYQCNLCWLHYN